MAPASLSADTASTSTGWSASSASVAASAARAVRVVRAVEDQLARALEPARMDDRPRGPPATTRQPGGANRGERGGRIAALMGARERQGRDARDRRVIDHVERRDPGRARELGQARDRRGLARRADDRALPRLPDAGLLGGDRLEGRAEDRLVIERDPGHDRDRRGHDVGRVEPATEPDLERRSRRRSPPR